MRFKNDPIGSAIQDFTQGTHSPYLIVESDLCEDDEIAIQYLFRTSDQMPEIEKIALEKCTGKILDIGAAAGCHSRALLANQKDVLAIDISPGAIDYLAQNQIPCMQIDFMQMKDFKFDTILLLMNGIGLAGNLQNLPAVMGHLKSLINPTGKIICDSTDISYLYANEDGSHWQDINANYYGEMNFNLKYKDSESGWFPWLYIDQKKLSEFAIDCGFQIEIIHEGDNNHYLAELKID